MVDSEYQKKKRRYHSMQDSKTTKTHGRDELRTETLIRKRKGHS